MILGFAFELFKEKCKDLRDQHRRFCIEYDIIEPKLLLVHNHMKRGVELKNKCDMDGLLFALQVFSLKAIGFSVEGSNDEETFQSRIREVIEIIRLLRSDFNKIKSNIADYEEEEEEEEETKTGMANKLVDIDSRMRDIGELMQLFNVIGIGCFSEHQANKSTKMIVGFAFELFKEQCEGLKSQHRRFCIEYDIIEPKLLQIHRNMTKGKLLKDGFSMDSLLFALQVFSLKATGFSAEGSTDEENFQSRIGEVIRTIRQLRNNFNTIKAKIDEDDVEEGTGIGEELFFIAGKMKEMGELMQLFNVTGIEHFHGTHVPPVNASTKNVKPTITED